MATQGWMMEKYFGGFFWFSKGISDEYTYRVELLPHFARDKRNSPYLKFIEESGIELVCFWVKWAIFRKKSCDGGFAVYTDSALRLAHYFRVSQFLGFFFAIEWGLALLIGVTLLRGWIAGNSGFGHSHNYGIFAFLFTLVVGFLIFKAAWRARKNYKRIQKEEPFLE